MTNVEELQQALDFPWEKWTVFLHPEQRQWVDRDYNGPARISGSAGTGKTIVALHRATHPASTHPDARVAKGLEFRGVVVMACDDEVIPSQERIETVGDAADLQEVYDTERQLL